MCLPIKPFKIEREWEHAGLKCAVVLAREGGHRCGYVRVPPNHPKHGKDYDKDYDLLDVSIHGGLTFAEIEPCTHEDGTGWWFGFDCAHSGDACYDPDNLPEHEVRFRAKYPELNRHSFDGHYWKQSEVERETEHLAEQLAGYA